MNTSSTGFPSFGGPANIFRGCEPFIYDIDGADPLDSMSHLFMEFPTKKPALRDAILKAGILNGDKIYTECSTLAKNALWNPEINKLGLSVDEAGAIALYTFQFGNGLKSPYQIINESLAGSRDRKNLVHTKELVYLILSGLRKLPRTRPGVGQQFYRSIDARVPTTQAEANGRQYYEKGKTVTWWSFTSTSTKFGTANTFIKGSKAFTVFIIGGIDLWGYGIKAFSNYVNEDEVLLEPEARVCVDGVIPFKSSIIVNVILQPFDHLVLEGIIPVTNSVDTYFQTSVALDCAWKKCPDYVSPSRKYSVDAKNPRIATKIGAGWCTIIGYSPFLRNVVTSWNIKILKSYRNDGGSIRIGVAPLDIDQNDGNNDNICGWYFECYRSKLHSGPPHNYGGKNYGPRKKEGEYVRTGDTVGVVMNTITGELSFAVNGTYLGFAYSEIPLDKPLAPCVILRYNGDSIKFEPYPVDGNTVNRSNLDSPAVLVKGTTWDSIALAWNPVKGASFYQIEVDGEKLLKATVESEYKEIGLPQDTEHTFRVRTVKGNSVSPWCKTMKINTPEKLQSGKKWECSWKKCPDYVDECRKYIIDEKSPRIATKMGSDNDRFCVIAGEPNLPSGAIIPWNIRVLKSKNNDGGSIRIGVAPFDINQNDGSNDNISGWYFECYRSKLHSGPPHNFRYPGIGYGPKKWEGEYVRTGDVVGVVMDTAKGELSFALNGADLGVAYTEIPLGKPLIPCVLLKYEGDSVEIN